MRHEVSFVGFGEAPSARFQIEYCVARGWTNDPSRTMSSSPSVEQRMANMALAKQHPPPPIRRPGLTQNEIEELRQAFDLFDTNGNGKIDVKELRSAMQSLGFDTKNPTIYQMIQDIDKSSGTEVDFDEFLNLMTSRLAGSDTKEDIQKIFDLFDDDHTGYISLQNLKRVAAELGENMDDAELLEMIERADFDRDGQISPDEFFTIMTQKTFG
jgi:Ca2+-binding EF-hand superfamily protein